MFWETAKPVSLICLFAILFCFGLGGGLAVADEKPVDPVSSESATSAEEKPAGKPEAAKPGEKVEEALETVKERSQEAVEAVKIKQEEIAKKIDESDDAKKYSAGILEPIYSMAEYMSFSSFYWIAFAVMVSGVVSFALQLVIGKLAVLVRGGFSFSQILTDMQGLVISLVGLFYTTQAATENSNFTTSPAAVLSAAAIGLVAGFFFYLRGQATEIEALEGRREEARIARAAKNRGSQ